MLKVNRIACMCWLVWLYRNGVEMTGRYENVEDVIVKALKLLEEWEKGYQEWQKETKKKLAADLTDFY